MGSGQGWKWVRTVLWGGKSGSLRAPGHKGGLLSRAVGGVLGAEERGYLRGREVPPISSIATRKSLGGLIPAVQPDPGKTVLRESGNCWAAGRLLSR